MMQASVANNEGMLLLSEKRYEEASSLFTKALFYVKGITELIAKYSVL